MPEVIFEYNEFVGVWHRIGLTVGRTPSSGDTVRKNAYLHHLIELCLRVTTSPLWCHPSYLDWNCFLYTNFLALVAERVLIEKHEG